jgi:hypothetical protein
MESPTALVKEDILVKLDAEILRHHNMINRGMNNYNEREALQDFRLKAFGSKLELPKQEKYEGAQRVRF